MPAAQVIDLSPTPRKETTLEQTVGAFVNKYRQNQVDQQENDALKQIYGRFQQDGSRIEETIQAIQTDPNLSPSRRVETMNQLLGFHKINQGLQRQAANEFKKSERDRNILSDLEQKRGLEPGSLESYEGNVSLAERLTRPETNKSPPGGLGGIPIDSEEAEKIENIIKSFPDASAEELEIEFNKGGITPGRTKDIIESRRRTEESNRKNQTEDKKATRKEELDFHKETQKYDEELYKNLKAAKSQKEVIKNIVKSIDSGNVRPTSWANIFRGFGEIGQKFSNAFLNEDEATLQASIPSLLEGWKEVFGVRLSDADLKVLQDKLPDMGKTPAANKAILKILKKYGKMTTLRASIADEIKKENKGLRPLGYVSKIENRFDELTSPVRIVNPKTGRIIQILNFELEDALAQGATLADE